MPDPTTTTGWGPTPEAYQRMKDAQAAVVAACRALGWEIAGAPVDEDAPGRMGDYGADDQGRMS
jgi:uncharacterized protein (DUF58 family)